MFWVACICYNDSDQWHACKAAANALLGTARGDRGVTGTSALCGLVRQSSGASGILTCAAGDDLMHAKPSCLHEHQQSNAASAPTQPSVWFPNHRAGTSTKLHQVFTDPKVCMCAAHWLAG